uniref:Uncharacterized protein n=1 Tax=Callorhinchus milii TaxID=7868 RepID=A0A4W3GJU2_CALMI
MDQHSDHVLFCVQVAELCSCRMRLHVYFVVSSDIFTLVAGESNYPAKVWYAIAVLGGNILDSVRIGIDNGRPNNGTNELKGKSADNAIATGETDLANVQSGKAQAMAIYCYRGEE